MNNLRPADLARDHGLSTQAVRNYEDAGFLPPAERTASGYRIYTPAHAAALDAYLALVRAHGHATAGRIMTAVHAGDLDTALLLVDRGHEQSLRDRDTLDAVRRAIHHLTIETDDTAMVSGPESWTIGELAHRLEVTAATLRKWERAGILAPARESGTGYRRYGADDRRDAELAHLLRRGGYPLSRIATVVEQVRAAGGTDDLARALRDWRGRLTARSMAMLDAAGRLAHYLRVRES
ncbi:MerR family DNA-binding transcriptional regulator [Nocardia yunnanensis]|uniref:MerR family DNA-binding transcriptional regulator n=1 Tax=Nocardia yunnanensis TaxID=2382165 RepID=A0A386ZJE1_9NOCA|nr:TioE family transcriptional regulator [Nocardia yunnanensis]AYF77661.1 MerR family DNA-binding transcriptional regulator [Nocardia yunnanensis]